MDISKVKPCNCYDINMEIEGDCPVDELKAEVEKLKDKLHQIKTWAEAYPLDAFPEPVMAIAHQVLQDHGLSLGNISASNMRHVLNGVIRIVEESED